ncbi:MAG: M14 family metallopeptidase [Lachnospiraceae bacterium]
MIKTVCKAGLPIDETLEIKKNRLKPESLLEEDEKNVKRISIVTGIHGDELEGQYVCYELIKRIEAQKEHLHGIVDIYPALNPLGVDSVTRGIPFFELDMNRVFPGAANGSMVEETAAAIIEDLTGSDICVDIHASNIYLTEVPQIRINELHKEKLLPYAKMMNVDFVWIHSNATVLESTLAYSLNSRNTPTLVVEMGVGMRLTLSYCHQLTDGIFYMMKQLGIWSGETKEPREAVVSEDENDICFLNASESGLFVHEISQWTDVTKGQVIGSIVNPLSGELLEEVISPVDGILFTIREYPIVDEGSLLARILERSPS